jgi:hypothetical protein
MLIALIVWDAAAMGATFAFTESVVANQRQINDPLNGMVGGCAAGFLAGIRGALERRYPSYYTYFMACLSFSSPISSNGGCGMCSHRGGSGWL